MKPVRITLAAIVASTGLAACSLQDVPQTVAAYSQASLAPVAVDLRVRSSDSEPYGAVDRITVPASHEIGDGMFPYEGIGWENGFAGYRIYLDGRLVADIFGKQLPEPALDKIGTLGSYHEIAPWGMDVLKVGPSLGIGGIGIVRGGQPQQFGSVPSLSATIDEAGPAEARFTINAGGVAGEGGKTGDVVARYAMNQTSPMTRVRVSSTGGLPLASGIVMHEGAEFWRSTAGPGEWRYIATWGDMQSENKDGLGMALFYRNDQASYGGLANQTHYVTFGQPQFDYGFLAAWELDASGVRDRAGFAALLERERARLNLESAS